MKKKEIIFKGKKGDYSLSLILSIIKVIFTTFVALILVAIVFSVLTVEIDSGIPKARVTMQKLTSSKAIIYKDSETNIYYPGIIDWQKFSLNNIDKTFNFSVDNRFLSMNLTLIKRDESGNTESKNIIYNKKHYAEMLGRSSMKGVDSTRLFNINPPVLIYDKGTISQGCIKASILIPAGG